MTHPYDDGYDRESREAFPLLLLAVLLFVAIVSFIGTIGRQVDRATDRQSPPGLWESTPVSTEVTGG